MTNLAGVYSEVAAYEFTTLTTVPGNPCLLYNLPGNYSTVRGLNCQGQIPPNGSKPPSNISIVGAKSTLIQQILGVEESFCHLPKKHMATYWYLAIS